MSDPATSKQSPPLPAAEETGPGGGGGAQVVRAGLQLVRIPVDKPQPAVAFLHMRGEGVMDLIAHFWERLSQTPPLQRSDLHLVVATPIDSDHENINIPQLAPAGFSGAMLYVPKAHRADVLAVDPQTAAAFATYICHQGPKALRSDNSAAAESSSSQNGATAAETSTNNTPTVPLTDLSAGKPGATIATQLPAPPIKAASANGEAGAGGGAINGKVPIDFLTGLADGIFWMTPLLLPVLHRKAPARQLVNVVMQLPSRATCHPDPAVRVATTADIPSLNRWRRLYKDERGILFDGDFDAWVETQRVFVYEHDKQAVAFAKFDLELPSLIEIGGVFTLPEFRKQGFGAKIVADLACRIRLLGKTPTLQVDEQNTPALRLYEAAGWKSMGKLARVWLTG